MLTIRDSTRSNCWACPVQRLKVRFVRPTATFGALGLDNVDNFQREMTGQSLNQPSTRGAVRLARPGWGSGKYLFAGPVADLLAEYLRSLQKHSQTQLLIHRAHQAPRSQTAPAVGDKAFISTVTWAVSWGL